MCEKVKLTVGDFSGKDGELGPSVFEDMHSSPKKPWQARENNLNRGDQDSVFSVGQTLRIRTGPLKGYLYRVIVLRRNDVTVKLDSQQKVLTVKCEHLSEVQAKGTAASMLILLHPSGKLNAQLAGKGFVYIEAERQCHINEACNGITGIYVTRVQPVPSNEVSHLFSVRPRNNEIAVGTWAHVKSGHYKGDIAQIVAVNNTTKKVTVKLIPRIDLQALAAKLSFIDKFRYNAKRASLVQSRIKALERMGHVDEIVNNPDYKFEFPTPYDRPGPPIISFSDAS
ncbi:hypothetical protein RIF29_20464 [Crotalaria pallida]|uniref:KOW domain-containing protein n=1 Tax=Crotalaria pallida TaxID=3830 RepID=A0AAN9F3I3_CROPI